MSDLAAVLRELPGRTVALDAGDTLFRLGDQVERLHLVEAGCLHLVRYAVDGRPAVMQRACAGMIAAESSLFSETYHCDGLAVAATRVRQVSVEAFRAASAANPQVMSAVARHLAREVQQMRMRLEIRSHRTVRERFDAWLALNGGIWPARGVQIRTAEELGVSPEAFYRELQRRRSSAG